MMSEKPRPKFTVITCSHNCEKTVEQTMKSVLGQDFQDFEYLLIYNTSDDKTWETIKKYKDPRIRIVKKEPTGVSDAMNMGIREAKGEILIHLHADDYFLHNQILSKVARVFDKKPNFKWLYGKAKIISIEGKQIGEFGKKFNYLTLTFVNYIPHQATFIKKEVFEKCGNFRRKFKSAMDYDLWLRIGRKYKPFFINDYFISFRMGGISTRTPYLSRFKEASIARINNLGCLGIISSALELPVALIYKLKNTLLGRVAPH